MEVQRGDRVGIMAGNCEQYVAVFFGVARAGAVLVVLNNTYTGTELDFALGHTGMFVYIHCCSSATGEDLLTWMDRLSGFVHRLVHWAVFVGGNVGEVGPPA